ncbi:MAG: ATP:cob(I)alamin adenosyltransferase [Candidatus Omnitrophica bacterium]|nr:ATP:cob(I)alamin adenosyltransferase [Candidatus Omnitrophota bacterium]
MSGRTCKKKTEFTFFEFYDFEIEGIGAREVGDLDELVSYLGLVKCKMRSRKDKAVIEKIQHSVLTIAAEIAVPPAKKKKFGLIFGKERVEWIQTVIYELQRKVRLRKSFNLPGANEICAILNISGAIARRAERNIVDLFRKDKIKNANILSYLDCVSNVLVLMARLSAEKKRVSEKKPGKKVSTRRKRR